MFRSEPASKRSGAGKVRAPAYMLTRGGALVGTDGGVAPSNTHEGATGAQKAGDHNVGRRHIDPTKSLDDTAPQRQGKKVLATSIADSRPQWNTNFNDRNTPPPPRSAGGGNIAVEIQRREEGKVGVKKFVVHSGSNGAFDHESPPPPPAQHRPTVAGLTAEQRAVDRLKRYATRGDAVARKEVERVLAQGSAQDIITKESQLHRRELRVEAAQEIRQHQKPAPHKADHLPAPSAPNSAPFATTMTDDLKGHRGAQGSKRKTFVTETLQQREGRLTNEQLRQQDIHSGQRHRQGAAASPAGTPFDSLNSGAPYPEPPAVGQIVPKTGGRRPPHRSGVDNHSTNFVPDASDASPRPSTQQSVRRNPCHNRHSVSVFEEPPVPTLQAPRNNLRGAHEAKYSAASDRPATGGKGRVNPAVTTSLW